MEAPPTTASSKTCLLGFLSEESRGPARFEGPFLEDGPASVVRVDASWREISISSVRAGHLTPGDSERKSQFQFRLGSVYEPWPEAGSVDMPTNQQTFWQRSPSKKKFTKEIWVIDPCRSAHPKPERASPRNARSLDSQDVSAWFQPRLGHRPLHRRVDGRRLPNRRRVALSGLTMMQVDPNTDPKIRRDVPKHRRRSRISSGGRTSRVGLSAGGRVSVVRRKTFRSWC